MCDDKRTAVEEEINKKAKQAGEDDERKTAKEEINTNAEKVGEKNVSPTHELAVCLTGAKDNDAGTSSRSSKDVTTSQGPSSWEFVQLLRPESRERPGHKLEHQVDIELANVGVTKLTREENSEIIIGESAAVVSSTEAPAPSSIRPPSVSSGRLSTTSRLSAASRNTPVHVTYRVPNQVSTNIPGNHPCVVSQRINEELPDIDLCGPTCLYVCAYCIFVIALFFAIGLLYHTVFAYMSCVGRSRIPVNCEKSLQPMAYQHCITHANQGSSCVLYLCSMIAFIVILSALSFAAFYCGNVLRRMDVH